jgi:hypothetical protein
LLITRYAFNAHHAASKFRALHHHPRSRLTDKGILR